MKVLFLVHIEDMFRKFYTDKYIQNIRNKAKKYDKVIALLSYIENDDIIEELKDVVDERWDWGWGYEPRQDCYNLECVINEKCSCDWDYIISVSHKSLHEYTWIPEEIRDVDFWKNHKLFVGGGYDGECLADFECVLEYLELPYTRCESMIYGGH